MNIKNLLVVLSSAAVLTSCSSAYRSGQTPDDVYYSPARQQQDDEYVDVERQQGRYEGRSNSTANNNYDDYDTYRDDRFLRMSMGSPYRLSAYNDYMLYNGYMGFNNFRYNSFSLGFNNPWNSFYYWNSFYNPYTSYDYYNPYYYGGGFGGGYLPGGGGVIVKSPSINPISRPRTFNPGAYTPNTFTNTSRYLDRPAAASSSRTPLNSGSRYNNRNSTNSGFGNTMRRVLSGGDNNGSYYNNGRSSTQSNTRTTNSNNNTYSQPQRTYEAPTRSYSPPPASSSSGSSSTGGGGGGVSRPTRGGN